ncbi:hypothetical protein HOLleu_06823 [Holothuria leucospilota]|uniref:DUF6589 domain-containing protein n=1 Tax=Holothuria leucospilota TaxID=206669 RepID=A0A9Q1CLF4_HOLLE|nr:hypothetical protein HOLleu_06823 [Holothuria leucospilota]
MSKKPSILASNNFVIASVDNIDRSSSYAAVSAGNTDRGFHGTSLQAVEPISSSTKDLRSNVTVKISQQQQVDQNLVAEYHQGSSHLPTVPPTATHYVSLQPQLTINSFSVSDEEEHAYNQLKNKLFLYMLTKYICYTENIDIILPDFKSSLCQLSPSIVSESNIHFTGILAEPADSAETIRHVLDILHEKHGIGVSVDHLVVAGDAKTYEYMMEAKRVYGSDLDWLLPYLGEWHLLKNLQAPLMKVYLDAGLRQLLTILHKGATHTAVASASGFRKTHNFLLQSWEAMYRHQVALFKSHVSGSADSASESFNTLYAAIFARIRDRGPDVFQNLEGELVSATSVYETFFSFFQTMGQADATSQFWIDFIHRDMFNYVGLFLAIRLRQFNLRNVAVRKLAPIFHALDRPTYLKLVPHHMAAMKQYPPKILEQFHKGCFSVSITGTHGNCVALDEAHEMLINKEVKMSMTTTGMGSLTRLVHYLPFRARLMKAFKSEVVTSKVSNEEERESHAVYKLNEDNIKLYVTRLGEAQNLFLPTSHPDQITHIFTGEIADILVSNDLKSFYAIGETDLNAYIGCVVLNNSGRKPPKRNRRNLKTFTAKKKTVHKQKLELKDQKMQIASLRRQIALSRSSNQPVDSLMQFLCLPRAICTSDQLPFKSSKAVSSTEFAKRYPLSFLENSNEMASSSNRNTCYIVEGMFLINCPPLRIHSTFGEYASFLYRRWVQHPTQHFKAHEIHVIFDHPQRHGASPKDIERSRRHSGDGEPLYNVILSETACPLGKSWSKFLAMRSQKRLLVNFLSMELLRLHCVNSQTNSILITAGGFDNDRTDKAFCSKPLHSIFEVAEYASNHEEGDSRVWFHAAVTSCNRIIIYSPDRDTFHIGLPLLPRLGDKQVYVHLRAKKSDDLFLDMQSFQASLLNDLQLQKVGVDNVSKIPTFLQVLYVVSGCDFTSFFKGNSKKAFLDVFYRDADFITGSD